MNDETIMKLGSMIAGLMIIETCLIMGVDGAGMLIGGSLVGITVGSAYQSVKDRKKLAKP